MNLDKIKKDYMSGLEYKKIQKKHHITKNQLKYLIEKNNWKRTINNGYKGNKNAKGNKGGPGAEQNNKRALKTGEYESIFDSVLSDEEKQYYDNFTMDSKEALIEEIKLLDIRKFRMMNRIKKIQDKNKDMTIDSMLKSQTESSIKIQNSTTTTTHAESSITSIQKIEEALTRVQEARRRCVESYNKIKDDTPKENTGRIQIINDLPTGDEKNDTENKH